jgi:hypothetical protein
MRIKLFLFLACALLAGSAKAQCKVEGLLFPAPSASNFFAEVVPGTCLASGTSTNQTARLRWVNGNLALFDLDDGGTGKLLWCAGSPNACVTGGSLCLQRDGNLVIYSQDQCVGSPLWASNTVGANDPAEFLEVLDGAGGEHAAILNDTGPGADEPAKLVWISNNSD